MQTMPQTTITQPTTTPNVNNLRIKVTPFLTRLGKGGSRFISRLRTRRLPIYNPPGNKAARHGKCNSQVPVPTDPKVLGTKMVSNNHHRCSQTTPQYHVSQHALNHLAAASYNTSWTQKSPAPGHDSMPSWSAKRVTANKTCLSPHRQQCG